MNQIDIGTVLNKFNDTYDPDTNQVKEYGIRFLNDRGEKRTLICRKNVKSPKQQKVMQFPAIVTGTVPGKLVEDKGEEFYNLQRNGVMLVKAAHEDHPRSIKTCMIYGFKDFDSDTWLKVFH